MRSDYEKKKKEEKKSYLKLYRFYSVFTNYNLFLYSLYLSLFDTDYDWKLRQHNNSIETKRTEAASAAATASPIAKATANDNDSSKQSTRILQL